MKTQEETFLLNLQTAIAAKQAEINKYQGIIAKEVRFVENQHVKKGDTLVMIDQADYTARVQQARAMLKSAEAQTGVSRNAAEAAMQNVSASALNAGALQANINAATARLTRAQKDLDRLTKMFAQGATTQQLLDAAQAELQSATAQQQAAT